MKINRISLAVLPLLCISLAMHSSAKKELKSEARMQWVSLPGGTYQMGDLKEAPRTNVAVKPFAIARTEVTNRQYRQCVEAGACTPNTLCDNNNHTPGDEQPATCVNWAQAQAYAHWVGGRLPTAAEWEYAARGAGKDQRYPWGDAEPSCERAVVDQGGEGCGRNNTWPVCSKPQGNTEQGLCDMAGNVWEWLADSNGDKVSPRRYMRSGAWGMPATSTLASRADHAQNPDFRCRYIGFRPVRSL